MLEYLRKKCYLNYISDLHNTNAWKKFIKYIDEDDYSIDESNDAINYLLKENIKFEEICDAKEYLQQ